MVDGSGILVVVPCLDEAETLPDLLPRLVAETPGALIVVADGGSRDGSQAIVAEIAAKSPSVRLLDNPRRIQSAGINLAVETFGAGREWLVRVDAHCDYPPYYVARLLAAARQHGADSVVVPMTTAGQGCFQQAAAAAQNSVLGTGGAAHRHLGAGRFVEHGHHALMKLDRFVAVGGYDPGFSHNEDAELDVRLGAAGARLWLEPGAALVYAPRRTPRALLRQYFNYGQGRARTVAKHRLRLRMRQRLPLVIAPLVGLAVLGVALVPILPAMALLAVPMLAWALLAIGYGIALGIGSRSKCIAMAGLAAMIMHIGWSAGYWRRLLSFG
ncbi:glycosyltransferase family 2 protein [Polymorphobacter multimanifer]|uniref:Succinoglycan biosynthesis protein ExoA n=1 Tax=Polymorphobacter multimanifer TaxID=1070431 RepID=A0A841L1I9_9SPHN|nr:glycosyltransferase family 2 protein [Polymorphobacter multimanifer]MBB6226444.1 succinoglycan biosynthesis protein ExoA [Polymorphobacter multimanifer]